MKPTFKAPGAKRSKLKYDEVHLKFSFNFKARRYTKVATTFSKEAAAAAEAAAGAAAEATEALRTEDEAQALLRNWVKAVGTWRLPPILDVPMLPMSAEETALRQREEVRRSAYEVWRCRLALSRPVLKAPMVSCLKLQFV
jgi:hypothetical protein